MVAPPRTTGRASPTEAIGELGLPLFSGYLRLDPNQRLYGRHAADLFRLMRYDEPACSAFVNAAQSLLPTSYDVIPGGDTDADNAAAEHLASCIESLEHGMATTLRQQQSILWAGWCIQEIVYQRREDGTIGWRGWELRRQNSLERWETDAQFSDKIVGFIQRPAPSYLLRSIPQARYIHTVADDSEGSPEGLSPLRGMYKHWYMLRNIELFLGIALERFGTGLPLFEIEPGAPRLNEKDEEVLQAAIKELRQNEYAGAILPPGVRFRFANSPGLSAETYLSVMRYLRLVMLSTLMADFIGLGTQSGGGAYALGKDKSELFLMALNNYQQRMEDAINTQAVKRLYQFAANRVNRFGAITAPPRLTLKPIKRYDLQSMATLMELLHRIGTFTPSAEDEAYIRSISDLLDKTPEQIAAEREAVPPTTTQPTPQPATENEDDADEVEDEDTTEEDDGDSEDESDETA